MELRRYPSLFGREQTSTTAIRTWDARHFTQRPSPTEFNRVQTVQALLQHGASPNQRITFRSPVVGRVEADRIALHYVSSAEAAAALISAGADVNAADVAGTTPLMCAAFHGHTAVVRALVAAGASPLI